MLLYIIELLINEPYDAVCLHTRCGRMTVHNKPQLMTAVKQADIIYGVITTS